MDMLKCSGCPEGVTTRMVEWGEVFILSQPDDPDDLYFHTTACIKAWVTNGD
jgi:hypothetical protein